MSATLFIRHAETAMAGRFCGHSDPELNANGRAQLTALAALLAEEPMEGVYSSDLRRAKSTAQAIASSRNIPLTAAAAWREINFGKWEGLRWEEVEQLDPEYAQQWMAAYPNLPAPGGESFQAFESRVLEVVTHTLENTVPLAVVTHAGVLRVVLRHLHGCSEQEAWEQTQSYCCVVRCEAKGEHQ